MNARDRARCALENVPGWSGARLTTLTGGLTNAAWRAEKEGRRAVLKVDAEPRSFPFADRDAEARIQRHAAAQGLAGDVIHASPTVLLADYVEGRAWAPEDMHDTDNLARLGELLGRVHCLPPSGRPFDALRAGRLYRERIEGNDVDPAVADRHVGVLGALPPPTATSLCHNDVVAENIVATPDLKLLDWEYASDNDPMFDLAIVVEHHGLDDSETAALLDAYAGGAADRLRPRLEREMRRYRSLAWLWQAASP